MDRNREPDFDRWVADRMTSLLRSGDWDPDLAIALAAFHHRRNSPGVRRTGIVLASAAALFLSALLAFPATRSLARRCVGACMAQTGAVREFLGNGLHVTITTPAGPIQMSERRLAPDFSLPDADGKLLRLSDFRGRVVLLNFRATKSGPDEVQIPWFREFQQKYNSAGLAVLGIAMDNDGRNAVVHALPTTLLIDRAGRIAAIHTGPVEKPTYEKELRTLLAEH
jgi:peroxiredoxin